jgi:hypothetical protein
MSPASPSGLPRGILSFLVSRRAVASFRSPDIVGMKLKQSICHPVYVQLHRLLDDLLLLKVFDGLIKILAMKTSVVPTRYSQPQIR